MSIRGFVIGLGVVLVFIGVVVIGNARFEIHAGGDTGMCTSYFNGPSGDVGNADALQQKLSLGELAGKRYTGPSVDDLCNNERDQRGTWTWVLVGVGVVLAAGGVLIRPTKNAMAQPK
jgi:hypothetical protein